MGRLLIFFGKSGAGKDFVAQLFAEKFGYYRYDADADLTPEMIHAIEYQQMFSLEMRARYFKIVTTRIKYLLQMEEKIAVTQGLFKNMNRHELIRLFPQAEWIWVDAEDSVIEERVSCRNSMVTPEYARQINQFFEAPDFRCSKIFNNGNKVEVFDQVRLIEIQREG